MRALIAFTVIFGAFAGAYMYNLKLKRSFLCNTFYLRLAKALLHNEKNEMLSFEEVFSDIYNDMFEYKEIATKETALTIADNEMSYANDSACITSLLKQYLSSGREEISDTEKNFINACQNGYDMAKKEIGVNGKTAYLLYPGITLIILIILI